MIFTSGKQLLEAIVNHGSLYNAGLGLYVFHYNEDGAIAVYRMAPKFADELRYQAEMMKCPWHALLGFGGYIYDAKGSFYYDERNPSCEDWCSENYNNGGWEMTG